MSVIFIILENFCIVACVLFIFSHPGYSLLFSSTKGRFLGRFFSCLKDVVSDFYFVKEFLHISVLTILSHSCSQLLLDSTKASFGGSFFYSLKTLSLIIITLKNFFTYFSSSFFANIFTWGRMIKMILQASSRCHGYGVGPFFYSRL